MRTRGQPFAEAAVRAIVAGGLHAVLLVGAPSVGKTTLAHDLAAMLLCTADPPLRPCGACRACRLVGSGNHPDLHRLRPEGPGGQVRIGDAIDPAPNTVRGLIRDLALLPVEGGARVAIVEAAHRLNEDAQNALLKTLEEPPSGVTIVLCADDEERLLPTVVSRCARVRLGPVGPREIEGLLGELGIAEPGYAARLARLAGGRPGLAVAYATSHDAALARAEVGRALMDLAGAAPAARLVTIRSLHATAMAAASSLAAAAGGAPPTPAGTGQGGRTPRTPRTADVASGEETGPDGEEEQEAAPGSRKAPAAERRRGAAWLIEAWRDVTRDVAVIEAGDRRAVRDVDALEELESLAARLPSGAAAAFLATLERAGERLESNASPELLLDVLALRWPHAA